MTKFFSSVLDLVFPPRCPFCGGNLRKDELFCEKCQRTLPWIRTGETAKTGECFDLCVAPLWYEGEVRQAFHRYKFGGCRRYARPFGTLLAQCISDRLSGRFDCITWAPLSSKRLRERGYDQARLLAKTAAETLEKPALPLLEKTRNIPAQSGLEGTRARFENVKDCYALLPGADVKDLHILLIDDVVTTGATLSTCARILREAGAASVVCAAFAATPSKGIK